MSIINLKMFINYKLNEVGVGAWLRSAELRPNLKNLIGGLNLSCGLNIVGST